MKFETRLKTALAILARIHIRPIWYAPPPHRMLWRLGVRIRPPHFTGTLANFLWLWPVSMTVLLVVYSAVTDHTLMEVLSDGAIGGLSFAIAAAFSYGRSAEIQGLPPWADVESPDQSLDVPTTHWLRGGL
jgi:hypothetical protein